MGNAASPDGLDSEALHALDLLKRAIASMEASGMLLAAAHADAALQDIKAELEKRRTTH